MTRLTRGLYLDGSALRQARRDCGLTQEALAELADCDVRTIRNGERGLRLDLATVRRLAAALDQPITAIVGAAHEEMQTAERNMTIFWQWQTAFNKEDVKTMLRLYDRDAQMRVPGIEDLPSGGVFRGTASIRRHLEMLHRMFKTNGLTPRRLKVDAVDKFVFARGRATAVFRATGRRASTVTFQEIELRNSKIIHHTIVMDTTGLRRAVRDPT